LDKERKEIIKTFQSTYIFDEKGSFRDSFGFKTFEGGAKYEGKVDENVYIKYL
jgi:hypothetical protein